MVMVSLSKNVGSLEAMDKVYSWDKFKAQTLEARTVEDLRLPQSLKAVK